METTKSVTVNPIRAAAVSIRQVLAAGADGVLTDDPAKMNRLLEEMGYAKEDPRRPMVVAHRGGPASTAYPENTMPAMEAGFKSADAIEIDIVSARDGLLLFWSS